MLSSRILSSAMQRCGNRMVAKAASSLHPARSINTAAAVVAARTSLQPPITTKYQLIGSTSSLYNNITTGQRRYKSASAFNDGDLIEVTSKKSKHYGKKAIVWSVGPCILSVECLDNFEDGRVRICYAKKILSKPRLTTIYDNLSFDAKKNLILNSLSRKVKKMFNGECRKVKDMVYGPSLKVKDMVNGPSPKVKEMVNGPSRKAKDMVNGPSQQVKDMVIGPSQQVKDMLTGSKYS